MAQGYLGSYGSEDLEMKGGDYFDNLAMLSFLQDFKRDDEGNISSCKMHDLVHDFVQFLTETETIILKKEEVINSINVRHLCVRDLKWSSIYKQKNLRTLRHFREGFRNGALALDLLHQLKCLRVLSLSGYQFEELPSEVEQLLHLRYLDLSFNDVLKQLPENVCNLLNLQTLNLKKCKSLTRIPEGIGNLSNLRHLEVEGAVYNFTLAALRYFPLGIGRLRCLRTLDVFIVGVFDAENNEKGCMIKELKLLNHLHGHLKISGLSQVVDIGDPAQAELEMKEKLQSLELSFSTVQKNKKMVNK